MTGRAADSGDSVAPGVSEASGVSGSGGSWAVRLTFTARYRQEPWTVQVGGGFGTREDAVLHGWFARMYLGGFNLAEVAVGQPGQEAWEPLESTQSRKPAYIRDREREKQREPDAYRPRPGDRVVDVRAGSWGRTGVVAFVSYNAEVPVVLVRPDDRDQEGRALFDCCPADLAWLPAPGDACAAYAGGLVAGRGLVAPGWAEAVQAMAAGDRVVQRTDPWTQVQVRREAVGIGAAVSRDLFLLTVRLRDARRNLRLTQAAAGALLGVSGTSIANWETRDSTPSVPRLIAWARLVRLRLALLDGADRPVDCMPPPVPGGDREAGGNREADEALRLAVVLRERRQSCRTLTQTDVAMLAGVNPESVRRWERADRPLRTGALLRWARALGCTVTTLPDHHRPPGPEDPSPADASRPGRGGGRS